MSEAAEIKEMFERVASRYDFLNHTLSGGVDYWWRHLLARAVKKQNPRRLLDLATGSGDVILALQAVNAASNYYGIDFCLPMLKTARTKGVQKLAVGDGLHLPFRDASLDAITVSFGFRNWTDRAVGLREMARVLSPGGRLYVLEFSQPWKVIRPFYYFYLKHFLPRIASCFGAEKRDYTYLCDTIQAFPSPPQLGEMLREAGFEHVSWTRPTAGLVALHLGGRMKDRGVVSPAPS